MLRTMLAVLIALLIPSQGLAWDELSICAIIRDEHGDERMCPHCKVRLYHYDDDDNRIVDAVYTMNEDGCFTVHWTSIPKGPPFTEYLLLAIVDNPKYGSKSFSFYITKEKPKILDANVYIVPLEPEPAPAAAAQPKAAEPKAATSGNAQPKTAKTQTATAGSAQPAAEPQAATPSNPQPAVEPQAQAESEKDSSIVPTLKELPGVAKKLGSFF